ncbi:MAG: P-loop NTPase fold protein [Gallionella sp.]|nr:P-loop NTPase fold protein [Gallionella sp.]
MSRLTLLDDQPAATDSLHFERYLNAIERTVLGRKEITPMVVGVFGPWGCGKSTLLEMLEKKLQFQPDNRVGILENHLRAQRAPWAPWVVVKFSPWMYRNEKSLLLPLLATLAKKQPAFEDLIQKIVKSGPGLIKKLTGTLIDASTTGLPLLTFLDSVRTDKENAKDLQEKIADAVKTVTGDDKRIVFLIDDLDRCHDPKQIVNLLEQIKLFLHLDRCLFFIAADREQIVKAINIEFPDSGEEYLEKFVQLPFEVPPHHSHHLVELLSVEEEMRKSFRSLCEVLGNNPRKLKQLWNEAVLAMEVLKEELDRVTGISHHPDLELMLKWLLLKNCGELCTNPYRYLDFEKARKQHAVRDDFIKALGFKDEKSEWRSEYHRRLAVYLWNDLDAKRFDKPNILSLYAYACGENNVYARSLIEDGCFEGKERAAFNGRDFKDADLSDGHFHEAVFTNCDFKRADFCHADLTGAKFTDCELTDARFDHAILENISCENCHGLEYLDTEPDSYEQIADAATTTWQKLRVSKRSWDSDAKEALFKSYKTILDLHEKNGTLTDVTNERITSKGKMIKTEVLQSMV